MILLLSDAYMLFKEEESGSFSSSISGYGYNTAKELSAFGSFPALFCPLGQDRTGSIIAEELVKHSILFDPDIIRLPFNTPIKICYKNGEISSYFKSSASCYLTSEMLGEALSMHTNIKAVLMSSSMLSVNPSARAIIDQSLFINPRPFIVLDLLDRAEGNSLAQSIDLIKDDADLIIMEKDRAFEDLLDKKAVIVKEKGGFTFYKRGKVEEAATKEMPSSEQFVAKLLYFLESSGFLPDELLEFKSYDLTRDLIKEFASSL